MKWKPRPLNNFEPCKQMDCAWFIELRGMPRQARSFLVGLFYGDASCANGENGTKLLMLARQ